MRDPLSHAAHALHGGVSQILDDLALAHHIVDDNQRADMRECQRGLHVAGNIGLVGVDEDEIKRLRPLLAQSRERVESRALHNLNPSAETRAAAILAGHRHMGGVQLQGHKLPGGGQGARQPDRAVPAERADLQDAARTDGERQELQELALTGGHLDVRERGLRARRQCGLERWVGRDQLRLEVGVHVVPSVLNHAHSRKFEPTIYAGATPSAARASAGDEFVMTATALDQIAAGTLGYYEQHAESFRDATANHDVSQNIEALLRHITGAPPFAILDFGCGPGRDLQAFTRLGHRAVGLEGAAGLAAMARAATGCEVWQQDFLKLQLPAGHFDGIFANASLFHVPTQELPRVLRQLYATLRPGGVLFSSNPRGQNQEGWNGGRYGVFHDLESWYAYLTDAGLVELEHYYRPKGLPRAQQPWLASVWRRPRSGSQKANSTAANHE